MKLQLWYPVKPFSISQGFGENRNSFYEQLGMKGHNGIDLICPTGRVIRAAHRGVVTFTGEDGSGGLGVKVRTLDKFDGLFGDQCYWGTVYWHCLPNSFLVKPGDIVDIGTPLAKSDNTGLSTGPHLHFGLKPLDKGTEDWDWNNLEQDNGYFGAVNPIPYFSGYYAEDMVAVVSLYERIIAAYRAAIQAFTR